MKLRTFKMGGVHPPENKMASKSPIETLGLPKRVFIPLGQHIGAPAVAIVKKGDEVKAGMMIAKGENFISANIHSSVSGKVFNIDSVMDSNGYKSKAIVIDVEGDEWADGIDTSTELVKDIKLDSKDIVARIKECGIVGLGGACFPSHVKYMVPEGKKVDTLVINAVECEPYLTADHRVMLERTEEIMVGIEIMKKALNVQKAVVGIEANKPDAIEKMEKVASDFPGTEIHALRVQYPQGAEKQLIKASVNREVPSGKLPLDVGCVVNNVGTALAIYEAVQKNKPLVERVVTVTGKKVEKTANYMVRIGTPVNMLVEAVGGIPEGTEKIVNGGPMMGKAVSTVDVPVTKGTSGILFFDKSEARRKKMSNCIRCAKCVSVCPMGLEPYLMEKLAEKGEWEELERFAVTDCIECGSCSYTCPASRPLLDLIRLGKANVNRLRWERSKK